MIVDTEYVMWFCSACTVLMCVWLFFWDLFRVRRLLRLDAKDRTYETGDLLFGAFVGVALAVSGIVGVLRFHDVF